MSRVRFAALAVGSVAGFGLSSIASATPPYQDDVAIEGVVYYPDNEFQYYQLEGQSAYLQSRTNSGTSGGQLDGITSNSGFGIYYAEIFPEANITDYLTFGYFGIIDTHEFIEIGRADFLDQIVDTSMIMALQPGVGIGAKVEDFNTNGYDEATLVAALTGSFDSTEFLDLLDDWGSFPSRQGAIGLPQVPVAGETLDLIAFIGGANGDEGVKVGELNTTITRRDIPTPGATALLGLAGIAALRRRR